MKETLTKNQRQLITRLAAERRKRLFHGTNEVRQLDESDKFIDGI
ncbi:MAG TPA: hypothetical protein VFM69_15785 [Pricia sp.]|nr:hypothetical protein [Pricia sp.]